MPDQGEEFNADRIAEALRHVEMGFGAFSVWSTLADGTCKCSKGADCTSPGKHPIPQTGFNAMSRDPKTVKTMLSAGSQPNYGLVWPDGDEIVVILDIDGPDWQERISNLKAKYGPLPATKTTRTPSGGLHLFYRWPKGVPLPDTNHLHGFVIRFPMKGYVVGPGSAINGKVYADLGIEGMAVLPREWAAQPPSRPLITVGGDEGGYELPTDIPTGTRHDEIAKFVASRWNRGITKPEIEAAVRSVLAPLFNEPMDEARLVDEITHAWDTAQKKWVEPGNRIETGSKVETEDGTVIDPLAIEMRIERPAALDMHAMPVPVGIAMLLDHLAPLTDAPFSSLTLASVIGLAGLMGGKPTLRWRGTQRMILYGALVGDSNYARKGQAISEVMSTLSQIDPMLDLIREPYIPSSGPAFIDTLAESKGQSVLMVTTEMGKVLANAARENESLSYDMRDAWDGVPVGGRTRKTGKVSARDYHLSILGATTPEDLVAQLTDTDLRNGWANRWLWFWAERRDGGFDQTAENKVDAATAAFIRDGIDFARSLGGSMLIGPTFTMTLTPDASTMLDRISTELDIPAHGTVGVLRQRMPPIAVRIAMVAACLDQTKAIDVEHLDFGFGLTDYAVQSIRAVFGTRVQDEVAAAILGILAQSPDGWLNTSTIAKALRKDGSRTRRALQTLVDAGLVVTERRASGPKGGQPAVGYRLVRAS